MTTSTFSPEAARERFSSLRSGFAFFDAPGGTQVPDEVGQAIANALREASANLGAPYATSRAVGAILERAKADAGRFLGCSGDEISFGMNMTSLDFALSRTAGRDFQPGDEILTTQLDHDGGVAPWVELAADKGPEGARRARNRRVDRRLRRSRGAAERADAGGRVCGCLERDRNSSPMPSGSAISHGRPGAISWLDAVHYAAHEPIDVHEIGCDVLLCSPYKFCGPHLGTAYVKRELAETWRPYKARPSSSSPVGRRFETGTLPYELLAGFSATIAYLETLGGIAVLRDYERELGEHFVASLPDNVELYGPQGMDGRVPTFLFNVEDVPAAEVSVALGERGFGVWAAEDWYCVSLAERLPPQSLRAGIIHYNTRDEVDRLMAELGSFGR